MTFLAKAYLERLFPRAKSGEIFFEKDLKTEAGYVYFQPAYFENVLLPEINKSEMISRMRSSNSSNQWLELVSVLNDFEDIDEVNIGSLESYSLVDENFSVIEYSSEKLTKILANAKLDELWKSIQQDLRNIYPNLDFDVFSQDGLFRAKFWIPFKEELEQRFEFYPIIKILEKHNQIVQNIKLLKRKDESSILFYVFFDNLKDIK